MLNRNKTQVVEIVKDFIETNTDMFNEMVNARLNEILDARIKEAFTDKKFLKKMGDELSKAEARRLRGNYERAMEELSAKEVEMRDSPEPWFDMVMFGYDPERGAAIKTEYNPAFIKFLQSLGYKGEDDAMVQHYIGQLGAESIASEYDL